MKLTNGTMYALLNALNQPAFTSGTNGKLGYAIWRNIRILQNEVQDYEKLLNEAVQKYGEKSENGGYYIDTSNTESYSAFTKEMSPLAEIELDVELYQLEPGFELPYCESATPAQYALIEGALTKQPEKENKETDIEVA